MDEKNMKCIVIKMGSGMSENDKQIFYFRQLVLDLFKKFKQNIDPENHSKMKMFLSSEIYIGGCYCLEYRLLPEADPVFDQSLSKAVAIEKLFSYICERFSDLEKMQIQTQRHIMHLSKSKNRIQQFLRFLMNPNMEHITFQIRHVHRNRASSKVVEETYFKRDSIDTWSGFIQNYIKFHFKERHEKVEAGLLHFERIQSFRKFSGSANVGKAWVDENRTGCIPIKCESEVAFHQLSSNMSGVRESGLIADFWINFEGEKPVSLLLANFKGIPETSEKSESSLL